MMNNNILVISDCPTHPTDAGNRSCQLAYCNLLKNMGYKIYFLYFSLDKNEESQIYMKNYWGDDLFVYYTPSIQRFLQKVISKFCTYFRLDFFMLDIFCPWFSSRFVQNIVDDLKIDSIVINYIWLSKLFLKVDVNNKVIFTHDVFSYKRLKGNSHWFSFSPRKESIALMRCDKILAIQENESIYFQYLAPLSKVYTVYSPYHFHSQKIVGTLNLLFFSGGNEYNIKGIRTFLYSVFPQIKKAFPDVRLYVGGGICKALSKDDLDESVILKGFFENPADFYQLADIVINPISEGTGLKIKTFEAISYGKIVLAHPHSFEGVYNKDQVPMYCCKDAFDYVAIIRNIARGEISIDENRSHCEEYVSNLNKMIETQYKMALLW